MWKSMRIDHNISVVGIFGDDSRLSVFKEVTDEDKHETTRKRTQNMLNDGFVMSKYFRSKELRKKWFEHM